MDDVVRSRRLLLTRGVFCSLFVLAACGAKPMGPVGVSSGGATTSGARDAGPPPRKLDFLPSDYRARFGKVAHVAKSQHGLGRFEGDVLASDEATAVAVATGAATQAGAIVVMEHREKGTGKPGPLYVMKKEPTGWRFFAQDESGAVILDDKTNASVEPSCAACHADAPRDGIFLVR